MYHIDTRQHANFHQPSLNITKYQKAAYCLGVTVYNMLPSYIKQSLITTKNSKRFYKISYINIPSIPWMNIFNFKKVKYIHVNWIDT